MKILFYTNSFYPDPVGIAYYNAEWVEALRHQGHEVDIVTALPYYPQWAIAKGYQGRWRVEEHFQGARVTRTWVYVPKRQRALGRFLCELSFMLTSLPVLLTRQADCIIAVTPPFGVGLAAAITRCLRRCAFWLHVQDLQVDAGEAVGFLKGRWLLAALRWLERRVFNQATLVTTITDGMRLRILHKGTRHADVPVFPNWVDTAVMAPAPRENAFRDKWNLQDKFVVLYAGSLGVHQGLELLVDTAKELAENRDIVFVIAGDGHSREALADRVARAKLENVRQVGLQPKADLPAMLAAADVSLVLETRQMANLSMPSKSLNPLACGRPLFAITSPGTALARLVEESGAGVTVPPGNARVVALRLMELAHAPDRLAAMGAKGRAYALEHLARETILSRLPSLLDQAVAPPPPAFREHLLKRPMDIFLSLLGFVVSSPLWAILPVLIWATDHGPVFFPQERVGRNGRRFTLFKFRSMRKMELPQFDRRQARRGDPRVTWIGAWMRATAMDEVPQLWNILRGDISFVGPRALMPAEVEVAESYKGEVRLEDVPGYAKRVQMRPGLTGIAQVFARRDLPRRSKFRYDLVYARRQSLWLDIQLILRSGWNSLLGRWEAVGRSPRPPAPRSSPLT